LSEFAGTGERDVDAAQPKENQSSTGDPLTEELLAKEWWDDDDVDASSMSVSDALVVSIGGGLGSFALADTLRVFGVSTKDIVVVGDGDSPTRTYRYLAKNSQIPDAERLRSDAGSTMDNIWIPELRLARSDPGTHDSPAAQCLR